VTLLYLKLFFIFSSGGGDANNNSNQPSYAGAAASNGTGYSTFPIIIGIFKYLCVANFMHIL